MTDSVAYYDENTERFFAETVGIDMSALHEAFLAKVPAGGLVLDAGCGSGRDSKAFLARGYRVFAFDASVEMARRAEIHIGQRVAVRRFADVDEHDLYDGVWACASLLHLPEANIPDALARLWAALKPGGVLFLSLKLGEGERQKDGRHFTDVSEARLHEWLRALPELHDVTIWLTADRRPDRPEQWVNALSVRAWTPSGKLVTGGEDPFLPHLLTAIRRADEIDLAVAFIKVTGLRLLLPDLRETLRRSETGGRPPARVRVLTSTYLDVTDPEALRVLMLLQEQGAQVRVFDTNDTSFHLKAYIFSWFDEHGQPHGSAFIGSSNISHQALTTGLEWNYRVDYPGDTGFLEARGRFEALFADPRTVPLADPWIYRYEQRWTPPKRAISPGTDEREPRPTPTPIQVKALDALSATRAAGFQRGLVVLATGLGKTYLSAFDSERLGARRVLFVAHREEILTQAAETFLRVRPKARVGFYLGQTRDTQVDVLCASVQTLSRPQHIERFAPQHFDYVVVDEFHHAAAATYRRLLRHFAPEFLLGLTATPDRTDQSDILSLCDDNLVLTCTLFEGITAGFLSPFHYYGIFDESVDYQEIPWRNGRFDPDQLSSKLATLNRARHALAQWHAHAQQRTLAFCVSTRHAEFMAEQFARAGVRAAAVYAGSSLSRGEALDQLRSWQLQVVFSVDLFNEGVDLPAIDTIMMLRPTESKVLFLQQLGRGVRKAADEGKDKLVVLDFIGNHHGFLHKPQALLGVGPSYRQLADFARKVEQQRLELPEGCFINYDLQLIDFLKSLDSAGVAKEYQALSDALGRRPTLSEFYRAGSSVQSMRRQHGTWFALVQSMGDLSQDEVAAFKAHREFFRELEMTAMTLSYKMVLLEALQELDGWSEAPTLTALAERSWQVLQRRRPLLADLPDELRTTGTGTGQAWLRYWRDNPVNAWIGGNRGPRVRTFFTVDGDRFLPTLAVPAEQRDVFAALVQEVVDYRLASYELRRGAIPGEGSVVPFVRPAPTRIELPYFPNLRVACGHFKTGSADAEEYRRIGQAHGRLDPARHFIARASGDSMNGGKNPIRDGDFLLLEHVTPTSAGSITGNLMVVERQDEVGDNQYLLRRVAKRPDGGYVLKANNPTYEDLPATEQMRTLARLRAVLDPLELAVGEAFDREAIPPLFGAAFNPGNWNSGQVALDGGKVQVLLVTLNKQGRAEDRRYFDHWVDERTFHWQSQNATTPDSKRGREIIEHRTRGIQIHLFVREAKLVAGKAAPFVYHGRVTVRSHSGSRPMSVVFDLVD